MLSPLFLYQVKLFTIPSDILASFFDLSSQPVMSQLSCFEIESNPS